MLNCRSKCPVLRSLRLSRAKFFYQGRLSNSPQFGTWQYSIHEPRKARLKPQSPTALNVMSSHRIVRVKEQTLFLHSHKFVCTLLSLFNRDCTQTFSRADGRRDDPIFYALFTTKIITLTKLIDQAHLILSAATYYQNLEHRKPTKW